MVAVFVHVCPRRTRTYRHRQANTETFLTDWLRFPNEELGKAQTPSALPPPWAQPVTSWEHQPYQLYPIIPFQTALFSNQGIITPFREYTKGPCSLDDEFTGNPPGLH